MKKIIIYICIFFPYYVFSLNVGNISPAEGIYNRDIRISLESDHNIYYYFENSIDKTPVLFDPDSHPVILSANNGEEKNYKIVFTDKDDNNSKIACEYLIDRKEPFPPEMLFGKEDLLKNVFFRESQNKIFYRIDNTDYRKWEGEKIPLSVFYSLDYYSEDAAGNKSRVNNLKGNSGNIFSGAKNLSVLSPGNGSYYNKQILYIDTKDFEWIRYSFQDRSSAEKGLDYLKPIIIDKTGEIELYIAGKPLYSDKIVYSEIKYNVNLSDDITTEIIEKSDGKYLKAFSSKVILYSLNNSSFRKYTGPVKIYSESNSIKVNNILLKNYDDNSCYLYRVFSLINKIPPDPPEITFKRFNNKLMVYIHSENNVFYTNDSSVPDKKSIMYTIPFSINLEPDNNNGMINIKAAAFDISDLKSSISETKYLFSTKKPVKPFFVKISEKDDGIKFIIVKSSENTKLVYNINEKKLPDDPDINSPETGNEITIINPYGRDSLYNLKISAVDNYGNISDPLVLTDIYVDHHPPDIPEIILENKNIRFTSKDNVFFRFSSDGNNFSENWIEYKNPLSLESFPGFMDIIRIQYFSKDKSGNKSSILVKELDLNNIFPDTSIFDHLFIKADINYDLTIKSSDYDNNLDIYYSISDNNTEPSDPDTGNALYKINDKLVLQTDNNTEKYYTVKLLPVSRINGNKGKIKKYNIHIDKIKPELPHLDNLENIFYSESIKIRPITSSDNNIYYTYNLEDKTPSPPFQGIKADDNQILITIPENTVKKCRMKIGVEDRAGNRNEYPDVFSITLDSRKYPEIVLKNIEFNTLSNKNITIKKPDNDFIYRYELSNTESTLKTVNINSELLDSNLEIKSSEGEAEDFYLSIKAFYDIYDKKGSDAEIFKLKIDKEKPIEPEINIIKNRIEISGEESIYYSFDILKNINNEKYFKYYNNPFEINSYVPSGKYVIEAFSRDEAGNKSNSVKKSFYISRNILYVSEKNGNDENDGRDINNPLRTFDRAFSIYRNSRIDTIIFLEGVFVINNPSIIEKPLLLKGLKGKTIIKDNIKGTDYLFKVVDSSLMFNDITIASDSYMKKYFIANNSITVFDNVNVSISAANFLEQKESSCYIEKSEISDGSLYNLKFIISDKSSINIADSRINLFSKRDLTGMIISNGRSELENTFINLKSGGSSTAASIAGERFNLNNTSIKIISQKDTVSVNAVKSRININNSFFTDQEDSVFTKHFNFIDSIVSIDKSNIYSYSNEASMIINTTGGELSLTDNSFKSGTKTNLQPLLKADSNFMFIENCVFTSDNSIEGGFISSDNSITEIYRSGFNDTGSMTVLPYINIYGKGSAIIRDNIFADLKNDSGRSFILKSDTVSLQNINNKYKPDK